MELAQISLRERERAFVTGGTETGKTTLAEALLVDFDRRYAGRGARELILDSKPRFRAEYEVSGWRAKRRYRSWDHGPAVPDSVIVKSPDDMEVAWATGTRRIIAQADDDSELPNLVACAQSFYDSARASRPQLLYVDEVMDFYRQNGSPVGGRASILRSVRSGRERGLGVLVCSQRTRGIPAQLMEELTKLYLFRIDYREDLKRLPEMGAPPEVLEAMPEEVHVFIYWTKRAYKKVWGPYKLELPRKRR